MRTKSGEAGSRINRAVLRGEDHYRVTSLEERAARAFREMAETAVSRRRFLGAMGATAVAPPLLGLFLRSANAFAMERVDGTVRFSAPGLHGWTVDPRCFDGSPRLAATADCGLYRIVLSGAMFPGTRIAADFDCTIRRADGQWRMGMDMELGGTHAEVPFDEWLLCRTPATGSAVFAWHQALPHGGRLELSANGATLDFLPDWSLALRGAELGSAVAGGHSIEFDTLRLELGRAADASLFARAPLKRTRMAFGELRGSAPLWRISSGEGSAAVFRTPESGAFAEAASSSAPRWALMTESSSGAAGEILPGGPYAAARGAGAVVTARSARALSTFEEGTAETGLHAFPSGQRYVFSAAAQASGEFVVDAGQAIEWNAAAGSSTPFPFEPELERLVLPTPGADKAIFVAQAPEASAPSPAARGASATQPWPRPPRQKLSEWLSGWINLDGYVLQVRRASDLLVLDIGFRNLRLAFTVGVPRIEIVDPRQPAHLLIDFPPQHVGEQAILTRDTETCPGDARAAAAGIACSPAAFPENPDGVPAEIQARRSGRTRLAFRLADGDHIHYTLDDLLDWRGAAAKADRRYSTKAWLDLEINPRAASNPKLPEQCAPDSPLRDISPPAAHHTAIELPYRLILSPHEKAGWLNPRRARARRDRFVELWSTRLATSSVRAIWSPDYNREGGFWAPPAPYRPGTGFRMSLDRNDRHQLVALTSVYGEPAMLARGVKGRGSVIPYPEDGCKPPPPARPGEPPGLYVPQPVHVERLQLTALGGWLRSDARWEPPAHIDSGALSLEEWKHQAAMGRDSFVKVVYKGFLLPLGQRAALVKVTQRRFHVRRPGQAPQAVLFQRFYITYQKAMTYPAFGHVNDGRGWPHRKIVLHGERTPDIDEPTLTEIKAGAGRMAFWPSVGCNLHLFEFEDPEDSSQGGEKARYVAPLLFVGNEYVHDRAELKEVIAAYNASVERWVNPPGQPRTNPEIDPGASAIVARARTRQADKGFAICSGAKLRYAPSTRNGDTGYETEAILLACDPPGPSDDKVPFPDVTAGSDSAERLERLRMTPDMEGMSQPPFYPKIHRACIRMSGAGQLAPTGGGLQLVKYDSTYLRWGFSADRNVGELFLNFADGGFRIAFSGDTRSSGGVVSPDAQIIALSRLRGLVGGSTQQVPSPPVGVQRRPAPDSALPQAVNRLRIRARSEEPEDPFSGARAGAFEPKQFFAEVLGDAKLLGAIKLVDILDVVMHASGDRIPTMVQEYLHDLDQIRRGVASGVLERIDSIRRELTRPDVPEPVRVRIAGRLDACVSAVRRFQSAGGAVQENVDAAKAISASVQALITETKSLAADPYALLPEDLQRARQRYEDIKKKYEEIRRAFEALRGRAGPRALLAALDDIERATGVDLKAEAEGLLRESPFFPRYLEARNRIRERLATLAGEMEERAGQGVRESLEQLLTAGVKTASVMREFQEAAGALRYWMHASLRGNFGYVAEALRQLVKPLCEGAVKWSGEVRGELANASTRLNGLCREAEGVLARKELDRLLSHVPADERARFTALVRSVEQSRLAIERRFEDLAGYIDEAERALGSACKAPDSMGRALDEILKTVDSVLRKVQEAATAARAIGEDLAELRALVAAPPPPGPGVRSVEDARAAIVRGVVDLRGTILPDLVKKSTKAEAFAQDALNAIILRIEALDPKQFPWKKPLAVFLAGISHDLGSTAAEIRRVGATDWEASFRQWTERCEAAVAARRRILELVYLVQRLQGEVRDKAHYYLGRVAQVEQDLSAQLHAGLMPVFRQFAALAGPLDALAQTGAGSPWLGPGLKASIESAQTKLKALSSDLASADAADPFSAFEAIRVSAADAVEAVIALARRLVDLLEAGRIGDLVNLEHAAQEILASIGLPSTLRLGYDWDTPVKPFPEGSPVFEPGELARDGSFEKKDQGQLVIRAELVTDLLRPQSPRYSLSGRLSEFQIHLLPQTRFVDLTFEPVTFEASSGGGSRFDIKLAKVELSGDLSFVRKLQELLSPKTGFYLELKQAPAGIEVGYRFGVERITLVAFTLKNIFFSLGCMLPFDNRPARFQFRFADPERPFLIVAGVYGGGGYFGLGSQIDRIEYIDASFEYGAIVDFGFGPVNGTGRVMAGIYIRQEGSRARICGFVVAAGEADIAGLISMCVQLRVRVCYENGSVVGSARFRVSFKLGFISYGIGFTAAYAFAGDSSAGAASAGAPVLVAAAPGTMTDASPECVPARAVVPRGEDFSLLARARWRAYWAAFDS